LSFSISLDLANYYFAPVYPSAAGKGIAGYFCLFHLLSCRVRDFSFFIFCSLLDDNFALNLFTDSINLKRDKGFYYVFVCLFFFFFFIFFIFL
jgi:hypothetical protein